MEKMDSEIRTPADVSNIFIDFQEYLNSDYELRETIKTTVREIEQAAREIQILLQPVHQQCGSLDVGAVCEKSKIHFTKVQSLYSELAEKIPDNQFYRFCDHWRFVTQRLAFLSAFVVYLSEERLASREEVADLIGVKVSREDGFHMDLDDYLMGLLTLTNELSRLAMNAVTAGDYAKPVKISQFVSTLDSGFRLLNLKNDALRKRFDGLKYDVKRCEEIVYDLTIRGLVAKDSKEGQ